ncbi:MAG: hypothetical protein ACFFBP_18820 [Promethearchaeota archaeon]
MKNESINNLNLKNLKSKYKNICIWFEENHDFSTSLEFIETLKQGISILLMNRISSNTKFYYKYVKIPKIKSEDLSVLLGQKKNHIKNILRKATINTNYIISLNFLHKYELKLRVLLLSYNIPKQIITSFIDKTIYKYKKIHNPPFSNSYRSKNFHPKLIENYFESIDTVEKAYWLGLLWAEGWISKSFDISKKYANYEIGLKQSKKNFTLIRDYCSAIGFNQKYLNKYRDKKSNSWSYLARFMNSRFAQHLINKGFIVGNKKSLNIELPKLVSNNKISQKELYLGFILGYYDGDGTTGRTKVSSGSYTFLKQIKDYFDISNKILRDFFIKKDNSKGIVYKLELGRDLMLLMLNNYKFSFKLKRKAISNKLINTFNNLIRNKEILHEKGEISEIQYQNYIWNLGHKLEFTYDLISDKCKEFYVEPPSKEKWELNELLNF